MYLQIFKSLKGSLPALCNLEKCEKHSSHRRSMTPDGDMDLHRGKKNTGMGATATNTNILTLLTLCMSLLLEQNGYNIV